MGRFRKEQRRHRRAAGDSKQKIWCSVLFMILVLLLPTFLGLAACMMLVLTAPATAGTLMSIVLALCCVVFLLKRFQQSSSKRFMSAHCVQASQRSKYRWRSLRRTLSKWDAYKQHRKAIQLRLVIRQFKIFIRVNSTARKHLSPAFVCCAIIVISLIYCFSTLLCYYLMENLYTFDFSSLNIFCVLLQVGIFYQRLSCSFCM